MIALGSVPPDWLAPDADGLQRRLGALREELYAVGPPARVRAVPSASSGEAVFEVAHLHSSTLLRWRLRLGKDGRLLEADIDFAHPRAPEGFDVRLAGDLFIGRLGSAQQTFETIGPGIGPGGGAVRAVDTQVLVDYLTTLRTYGHALEDMDSWWPRLDGADRELVETAWEWSLRISAGNWRSSRLSETLAATASTLGLPGKWRELVGERGPPADLDLRALGERSGGQLLQFLTKHPASGQLLYWELGFFDLGREGLFRLDVRPGGFPDPDRERSRSAASGSRPPAVGQAEPEDDGDRSRCLRVNWWPRLAEPCRPGDVGVAGAQEVVIEVFNACDESVLIDAWLLTGYTTKIDRSRVRAPALSPLRETAWDGSAFAGVRLEPLARVQRTICNWLGSQVVAASAAALDDRQLIRLEACSEAGDPASAVPSWRRPDLLPRRRLLLQDCTPEPRSHYVRAPP
jgi:hypothetical protein